MKPQILLDMSLYRKLPYIDGALSQHKIKTDLNTGRTAGPRSELFLEKKMKTARTHFRGDKNTPTQGAQTRTLSPIELTFLTSRQRYPSPLQQQPVNAVCALGIKPHLLLGYL